MHPYIESWLSLRVAPRIASGCLVIGVISLANAGLCLSLAGNSEPAGLTRAEENARLKMRLQRLPSRHELEARRTRVMNSAPPASFQALSFCQRLGVSFISWQPGEQSGGELVADAAWQAIPGLFGHLSQYALGVSHFSLAQAEGSLRLTLGLERIDAY